MSSMEPASAEQRRPRPVQPWPPALIFHCPDGDGWTWHASDARGYEAKLERAWRQHLAQHGQGRLLTPEQLSILEDL
jgi:hypothetical protein